VEGLAKREGKQRSCNDPSTKLLQEWLALFKKTLPEVVKFGLNHTASTLPRGCFNYGHSGLHQEEILRRLTAEWLRTGEVACWTRAWTEEIRKQTLRSDLQNYKSAIIKGELESLSQRSSS
jgi:hypothetical protein